MYSLVYDDKFDILYIREKGKGNFDYLGDEDENGVVKFLDQETKELKGFMIYGFAKGLNLLHKNTLLTEINEIMSEDIETQEGLQYHNGMKRAINIINSL